MEKYDKWINGFIVGLFIGGVLVIFIMNLIQKRLI